MRRRILLSILAVVLVTGLLLGLPLTYTAWLWVEDFTRRDLQARLDRISAEIIDQEGQSGVVEGSLDVGSLRVAVPAGGRLSVVYPSRDDPNARIDIGAAEVEDPLVEAISMGRSGSLRLETPSAAMRTLQQQAVGGVALMVLVSLAVGTAIATVTARRLADPMQDVADRAARLAKGDFRTDARRYGIPELDRVSDVLDSVTVEIAGRLQRERALVGDVSHQLRSRLTAVRLRLDELSVHPDPDVVDEANAAMAQVDRLTVAIDELVRSSRIDGVDRQSLSVVRELDAVVAEWQPQYQQEGRSLVLRGDRTVRTSATPSRLREAVAVLVDNALMHGGGTCTVVVRVLPGVGPRREAMVCVEVGDEGDGVSDQLAPHIFDRGFSAGGSTGVGLALARALVEADGGRLDLQRRRPALFALFLPTEPRTDVEASLEPR
ncbi:sensor histidine kinase [Rhodococcus sp. NPDC003318]|uniref:sensor histidine kinase n=1 Tax=Rhodococcus sp. NPDC003318 TaxID=3364503 RepID=UPI0036C492E6